MNNHHFVNTDSTEYFGTNPKLSPRQLVEKSDSDGRSDNLTSYLTCLICFKILKNPVECSKCETAFCSTCIETWKKQSGNCPVKCAYAKYQPINPRVGQYLD